MSAAHKPRTDPGSLCRELCRLAAKGQLPRLLILAAPAKGEEEPWFAEQVLQTAREAGRKDAGLDLLDLDGGGEALPVDTLDGFLQAASLFADGARALLLARAGGALNRLPRLAQSLAQAALDPGGPSWIVLQLSGKAAAPAIKTFKARLGKTDGALRVESFRRLYGDPPPWRPHDLDASEAAQFVLQEARERGLSLRPGAAGSLVGIAGARPSDLVQALDHFELLGLTAVDEETVRETVAHSAEGSAFEFAGSVLDGDGAAALRLLEKIRARGLHTWSGKRLGPQDAFSMLLAVLAGERRRTEGVRLALDRGVPLPEALKQAGVASAGPAAKRMERRVRDCDEAQLGRVLRGLRLAERRVKVEGQRDAVHALEELAFSAHRSRSRR